MRPGPIARLALLTFAALVVACTSNDPPPEPSPTVEPTSSPSPTTIATPRISVPTPTADPTPVVTPVPFPVMTREEANARRTGDPQIDRVIDALLGSEQTTLDALAEPQPLRCGVVTGVACEEDDALGTDYLFYTFWEGCGGVTPIRARSAPFLPLTDPTVFTLAAVFDETSDLGLRYKIVFEGPGTPGVPNRNTQKHVVIDGRLTVSGVACSTVKEARLNSTGGPLLWPVSFPDLVPPGTATVEPTPPPVRTSR